MRIPISIIDSLNDSKYRLIAFATYSDSDFLLTIIESTYLFFYLFIQTPGHPFICTYQNSFRSHPINFSRFFMGRRKSKPYFVFPPMYQELNRALLIDYSVIRLIDQSVVSSESLLGDFERFDLCLFFLRVFGLPIHIHFMQLLKNFLLSSF